MAVTHITTNTSTGGVPGVGVKEWFTTGTPLFVNSNTGASTNNGLTSEQAVDSLATALALATANVNDVILLMPNHAETLAASLVISIEGVTVLGLGNGDNRPVITFDTATSSDITVNADNVRLSNIVFKNDIDSQVNMIDVAKGYCIIDHCEFWEGSGAQYLIGVSLSATASDNCVISNCTFVSKTSGADSGIKIGAALDNLEVSFCRVVGDWSDAALHNPTGNVATNLYIHDSYFENDQTGDHAIELVSACTGTILRCGLYADADATVLDPGSCKCVDVQGVSAADTGSITFPLGATGDDFIGRDNADNNAATTNVVANADGSVLERQESMQDLVGVDADGATTNDVQGKLGTDTEMADRSHFDILVGDGPAAFPAAAAAANDVSLAEVLRYIQETQLEVGTATGDTDIDIDQANYLGFIEILRVTAPASGLISCRIDIDINKAATGLDIVATAADTVDMVAVGTVDGTNFRTIKTATQITLNGDATLEDNESGFAFDLGPLAAAEIVTIQIKLSAERGDAELPYRVTYVGAAPTVLPVAAI